MRLAVVTPSSAASAGLARARSALPALAARVELEVFVEQARAGATLAGGLRARSAAELDVRRWEQILYTVEDDAACGFLAPLVRRLGGTVALGSWTLPELARAARPALARGGVAGFVEAWREGGWADARGRGERVLNRSIVRFADAFLVPDEGLAQLVRTDRNAPTPIAVFGEPASGEELASAWLWHLERFPAPRSRRRSLVRTMIEAADRRRHEAAGGSPPGSA